VQTAAVSSTGAFTASFDTHALAVANSPYRISFSYAGSANFNTATGSSTLTVIKATPVFSNLSSPTITYGTATTMISGTLLGNGLTPPGSVTITINGVSVTATIRGNGSFSATFNTKTLAVTGSPYTVSFSYAGSANFNAATGSSTLTVNKATPVFSKLSAPTITVGTATTTISGILLGNGLAPSGSVTITINGVSQTASINSQTGAFSVTFNTSALQVGTYTISFTYAGDSNFTSATGSSTLKVKRK
jgi:hypothetical protein